MSKAKAKKIAEKYAEKLKAEKFSFSAVWLFGSATKDKAHKWSDIDIAVVSKRLNRDREESKLWEYRHDVSDLIEPHGFTPEDFADYWNPMAHEIKKTGIRVA
ncbi:MAG: nucleotidyltransferase domain-containing protein [Candidatus Moranbacteria bacterium]|nr:nucleotidyltransferase domain-containing protein [Candidatus Moranbacteria bacterium]